LISFNPRIILTRDGRVPGSKTLGVLSGNAESSSVGASEHHWAAGSASRHVERFCGTVDNLVDGLHREVVSHKLADWLHATSAESGSDSHASESHFGNWGVNDSVLAVLKEYSS
jgi:hypothetical protein